MIENMKIFFCVLVMEQRWRSWKLASQGTWVRRKARLSPTCGASSSNRATPLFSATGCLPFQGRILMGSCRMYQIFMKPLSVCYLHCLLSMINVCVITEIHIPQSPKVLQKAYTDIWLPYLWHFATLSRYLQEDVILRVVIIVKSVFILLVLFSLLSLPASLVATFKDFN